MNILISLRSMNLSQIIALHLIKRFKIFKNYKNNENEGKYKIELLNEEQR